MKKVSIFIMVVTVLSKLLGFVREAVLAAVFGTSVISDAFLYSYSLPKDLFSVIAAAFVAGFIPMFTRIEQEKGKEQSNRFQNNVLHAMFLLSAIISFVYLLFTEPILSVLLPDASPDSLLYIIPFTKVTIFSLFCTSVIQLMTGFLQIRDSFVFPMLMGFPLNIVLITTIYLAGSVGPEIMPYGILLAYIVQALLILGYARYKGYRYKFVLDLKDPDLLNMLSLSLPIIIGSSSGTFGNLINKAIVSGVEGGISYLNYSVTAGGIIHGIFGVAIISVMYPGISRAISLNRIDEVKKDIGDSAISVLLFVLPSVIGFIVLAEPILRFIYVRNAFTEANLMVLVPIFIGYAIGLVALSLRDLVTRVYYAFQETKIPMINSLVVVIFQTVLGVILFQFIGMKGVTLAMSIANISGLVYLFVNLRKLMSDIPYKKYLLMALKVAVAAVIMGVVVYFVFNYLYQSRSSNVSMFLSIFVGVFVYFIMILFMGIETVDELIGKIRGKVKG